ncbi:unnamed protein product [Brachionus calyciflorus]|uniref:TPX2 C-terminal domain-containing protein n=1 Tax=Brachionus calyciflorus TaxID=104777 RepID=A0A814D5P1_9BILA|nr:unnamed protein product [Brachionus calyciflorus]
MSLDKIKWVSADIVFDYIDCIKEEQELKPKKKQNRRRSVPFGILRTEIRAIKRKEFNDYLKHKEEMKRLVEEEIKKKKTEEECQMIAVIRRKCAFRANPIKRYKKIVITQAEKELTIPKTPTCLKRVKRIN